MPKSIPSCFSREESHAIMICGHGSRSQAGCDELSDFVTKFREIMAPVPVEYGYLEFAQPIIRDGLDRLRERGITNVVAVPGMLFAAGHAKNDIPAVLNTYMAEYPEMNIQYGREFGLDPKMINAAAGRIEAAIAHLSREEKQQTALVVVGRGASDPDANANVSKITRMLWEGLGLGWAETVYSGVTFPLVGAGLEQTTKLGFKRVVVFPYFWFTGILIERIHAAVRKVEAAHPKIEFIRAGYLSDHPQVLETLVARVDEVFEKSANMNCQMCKYRTQIIGFEQQVGLAQESHHHHAEGAGVGGRDPADCDLCDHACIGLCTVQMAHDHDHHHHHHPYPHADHPMGPRSMMPRKAR